MIIPKTSPHIFELPDGTEQVFDYPQARQDDLQLAPLSFDIFLKFERLPVFGAKMNAFWHDAMVRTGPRRWRLSAGHDLEEVERVQAAALFPMMLRLQALDEVMAHPCVQRFAKPLHYRELLDSPEFRHEFLSRHRLRDIEQAPHDCGWYPEELIEFMELTHRWGTHEIAIFNGLDGLLLCQPTHGTAHDHLPSMDVRGQRIYRLSGVPQYSEESSILDLTFTWLRGGQWEYRRELLKETGRAPNWLVDLTDYNDEG